MYLNERTRSRKGDIYEFYQDLKARVFYCNLDTTEKINRFSVYINTNGYRACLFSTYQGGNTIRFSQKLEMPTFGVVHNSKIFEDSLQKILCFDNDKLKGLFILEDHVRESLLLVIDKSLVFPSVDINIFRPYYWRNASKLNLDSVPIQPISIVVPGSVNFRNRNFPELLGALEENHKLQNTLRIVVLGGGKDRELLIGQVERKNLSAVFSFLPISSSGFVTYSSYFNALNGASFCLPLSANDNYEHIKITSAIPTSIGWILPALISKKINNIYNIPCFEYDSSLSEGLESLIDISQSTIELKKEIY